MGNRNLVATSEQERGPVSAPGGSPRFAGRAGSRLAAQRIGQDGGRRGGSPSVPVAVRTGVALWRSRWPTLPRLTRLQVAVHIAALIPLIVLIWDAWHNNLTVNPIQKATQRTGQPALVLLILTLSCTPLYTATGWRPVLKIRRTLGLYAFLYAAIHFSIYVAVDYRFDFGLIWLELAEKRYVLVGLAAFLILLSLAITSTRGWQRRLGKRWKRLHRLVYVAATLVVAHYMWVVKADIRKPLAWGVGLVILLLMRLVPFRRRISHLRGRVGNLPGVLRPKP